MMKHWDVWKRPLTALLAVILLLAGPMDGALAARDAVVKTSSATMSSSADGSGRAVFKLGKGDRVTVTAVKGNVAKVTYKGKTGYLLTSTLTLDVQDSEKKLLQDATIYQEASTSSKKLGSLDAGDTVKLLATKGSWAKVQQGSQVGFISKSAFDAPSQAAVVSKSAESGKAMITTVDAKVYASASTSSASKKVEAGTQVTVLSQKGGWYKVTKSGTTGFMQQKAFEKQVVKAASTAQPAQTSAYKTLKTGSSGASVLKLQKRLEALGYLDIVPSGKYAATTATAVKLFQSVNGLQKTGVADGDTQAQLYASAAKKSGMLTASIKPGGKGTCVQRLQLRLRAKGYFTDKVNGVYGATTQAAVKAYQAAAGLTQDGAAGSATIRSLYAANAPKASAKSNATPAPGKPDPTPTPKPTATPKPAATATPKPAKASTGKASSNSSSKAEKVIAVAKSKLGKPYVFGSVGPNSYDCSGLLMVAYGAVGLSLPHSACTIGYGIGKKVSRDELERGDIVCFNTIADGDLVDHVGIYLGGGSFLQASSGQGRVVISSLTGYYANTFSWGRSVF
jgi:cell wall-associated NlpC family hydrolase/SH3-like domain-containing protein